MIFLLHGENEVEKRSFLISLKTRASQEIITFDGRRLDLGQFTQAVSSAPLLYPKRIVIVEDFSPSKVPLDFSNLHFQVDLALVAHKKLLDHQLGKLPKETKVMLFKEEPFLFRFLDSIYPGNSKGAFGYFRKIKGAYDTEFLFWLLTQHVRRLIIAKEGGQKWLAEQERLQAWQVEKYQKLTQRFFLSHLRTIYRKIFTLEHSSKQGEADLKELLPLLVFELTRTPSDRYT